MIYHELYTLTGGTLFDGTGALPRPRTLVIRESRIESVGKPHQTQKGMNSIDITGCTALPGFVHAHAHPGFKQVGENNLNDYDEDWMETCLRAGITTVRDMGGFDGTSLPDILRRRDELNASGQYPRIVCSGKFFAAPGGYGGIAPITVSTEQEAREKVEWAMKAGVDFIKTSLEYGYSPDTALPRLSVDLLSTICKSARSNGKRVAVHASQSGPLRSLVEAGITDAGHVPCDPMDDSLIETMVRKGVTMTPTLTLYRMFQEKYGAPFLETALGNVRRFAAAGGVVAVGDDYIEPMEPWYRPGLPFGELELLSRAGLSNRQILQALTRNGAESCGLSSVAGTLVAGKAADIVVVRGDPLKDLSCLKDVVMVVIRGSMFHRAGTKPGPN